jgi:hypothetical protein
MSIYHNPELVRALMRERIAEAQAMRLPPGSDQDDRIVPTENLVGRLSRLVSRRSVAQPSTPCRQPC